MDNKLALTTCVTLAYRESLLEDEGGVSTELIKELLDLVKVSEVNLGSGTETDAVNSVKATVVDMCRASDVTYFQKDDLLARLRINVADDDKWYQALEKGLNAKLEGLSLLKSVSALRYKATALISREKIGQLLRKASGEWNFKNDDISDHKLFLQTLLGELEGMTNTTVEKDAAVNDEVRFDQIETAKVITDRIGEINSGDRIWKTGHQKVNIMTQGGFREGETWAVGALPHMDKTGTMLTLFRQFAQYNKPFVRKPGKRPTIARITMEDPLTTNFQYLYKDIMVNIDPDCGNIDPKTVAPDEILRVVSKHFVDSGYDVRMIDVNPSEWTFRSLFNYVNKLESEGCDVQVLMVDYLSMMPTTGCRQGPAGTELQDLFRRVRNFCRSRGILFLTPHQLSTEARNLTRGVVTDETLLPYITMKGYWQDCKGLDREFDGAFYVHIVKKDGLAYKAFCRDKHRIPGILDEDDKFFFMPFKGKMPVPDDIGMECIGVKRIGRAVSNESAAIFGF